MRLNPAGLATDGRIYPVGTEAHKNRIDIVPVPFSPSSFITVRIRDVLAHFAKWSNFLVYEAVEKYVILHRGFSRKKDELSDLHKLIEP